MSNVIISRGFRIKEKWIQDVSIFRSHAEKIFDKRREKWRQSSIFSI